MDDEPVSDHGPPTGSRESGDTEDWGIGEQITGVLEKVLAGDQAAGGWLYDTFATRLFRRLRQRYSYLGESAAEDLLHDVFVLILRQDCRLLRRFLERVPKPEQTQPRLERFLWDQACGVASNQRRSARSQKVVPLTATAPDKRPGAERQALQRDWLKRLEGCLAGGRKRAFLYYKLRYRDGLSPEQVAKVTGWSRKATYKLKEALNAELARCKELLVGAAG